MDLETASTEARIDTPVVLVTHGDWGQALLDAATFFMGPQENVIFVPLSLEESPESLAEKLRTTIRDLPTEEALFLVDLRGGTPWNVVAVLSRQTNSYCVSGLNLPMLLEVFCQRGGVSPAKLAEIATTAGKDGVVNLHTLLEQVRASKRNACVKDAEVA